MKSLRVALLMPLLTIGSVGPVEAAEEEQEGSAPRFELAALNGAPFPSDFHTTADEDQATGIRVALPKPNCTERPSDCDDIDVLNTLDGFNLNPRVSIPFDGDINASSVNSDTVFLVALDGTATRIGINQVVWDALSHTLYAESNLTLREATRYALIVTRGVLDQNGDPIEPSGKFQAFRHGVKQGQREDDTATRYRDSLIAGLATISEAVDLNRVAVASVFTTQSITPSLLRIRASLRSEPAPAADFVLGDGGIRTVFARTDIQSLVFRQQTGTAPTFTNAPIGLAALQLEPNVVGQLAYGRIPTVSFLQPNLTFESFGTKSGLPDPVGTEDLYFNLYVPTGERPAGGWPVAVIGPGANQNKEAFSVLLASKLAKAGIASLGINPVGRGFGPLSRNIVTLTTGATVTFPSGGRSRDMNGDGLIGSSEGSDAPAPFALVGSRDTSRQTILDHVQLVRAIEAGIDFDADGARDVDPDRISFIGWSFGSNYGVPVVAIEPGFKTAVFSAVGGPLVDNRRLGVNRNLVEAQLQARVPSLDNRLAAGFDDNFPLRDQDPVVNTVSGAMAIQDFIDRNEWALQSSDVVPFTRHLRSEPLAGSAKRAVLINIAKGDQTVPNPAASKAIRAGALEDVTMFYRHDLAVADRPALLRNPHQFMTLINDTAFRPISVEVEEQAAQFLASGGATVYSPQPARYFEFPIPLPLPETTNFIP